MITVGYWIIPTIITIIFLCLMFRPLTPEARGGYFGGSLDALFRTFWFIPILVTWVIYLALR